MTTEIALTLAILLAAVVLFLTERLRSDLVALLVLVALVVTGLLTPAEALSGFSNPAVVTVWAMFILSAGLAVTGVTGIIGRRMLRLSGESEARLIVVIMLTAGILSAFMNNIGVAALLLPVVLTLARQTGIRPSRLLMPLAAGCLLGGMMTLIGTPPNILASQALREAGLEPFNMFDFTPVGAGVLLAGTAFMVLFVRRLLPDRNPVQSLYGRNDGVDEWELYGLDEHIAVVELPEDSPLAGKTIEESRIGLVLGLTIIGLERHGRRRRRVRPGTRLEGGDQLLALGQLDRLQALRERPMLVIEEDDGGLDLLQSPETGLAELVIRDDSAFIGQTIIDLDIRRRFGINVLTLRRGVETHDNDLQTVPLAVGDKLLLHGDRKALAVASESFDLGSGLDLLSPEQETAAGDWLQDRLLLVRIPPESLLEGTPLSDSHLGDRFGLVALGIIREGDPTLAPPADTVLHVGDILLIEGAIDDLAIVRGLQGLVVESRPDIGRRTLESEAIGLEEAVLSPHTSLNGKTLREINFREKYDLNVLAIWRNGRATTTGLGQIPLQFGDAFLIYGPRDKIGLLGREADFIILAEDLQEPVRREKAWLALLIMAGVVLSVAAGLVPIAIAAVAGAALMVLSSVLSMEEAYRRIDWRTVFLIAGMIPLGIALEKSGAAPLLAERVVDFADDFGPMALLAALFILTNVTSQIMPNAVVLVLMAPIALNTAADTGLSPYALMMALAVAASAAFMSPIGHPANGLVMGPGGYRFTDYIKVGLPLTLVVLLVTLIVLPLVFPL